MKRMLLKLREIIAIIFRRREFDTLSAALSLAALRAN